MPSSAFIDIDLFDHDAVRALLARMEQELAEKDAAITAHEQKLSSRELEIAHLRLQTAA